MWVDSAVLTFGRSLPVYPDERTFSESVGMSQKCQEGTHALQQKFGHQNSLSVVQLVEQRLGLLQIERVEAFNEPAVDRSEYVTGLVPLALIAP
jgi:hypothetical protein